MCPGSRPQGEADEQRGWQVWPALVQLNSPPPEFLDSRLGPFLLSFTTYICSIPSWLPFPRRVAYSLVLDFPAQVTLPINQQCPLLLRPPALPERFLQPPF